jgi:hypothetical protein
VDLRDAFEAIQKKLETDLGSDAVEGHFDDATFGNFWVRYVEAGETRSIVNDRGQLILYEGPDDHFSKLLLQDLYSADPQSVLDSLRV